MKSLFLGLLFLVGCATTGYQANFNAGDCLYPADATEAQEFAMSGLSFKITEESATYYIITITGPGGSKTFAANKKDWDSKAQSVKGSCE